MRHGRWVSSYLKQMITLRLQADTLFQVRKNHLAAPVSQDFILRFTSLVNKKVVEITDFILTEYHNFYLFSVDTQVLSKLDVSATLSLVNGDNETVYQSDLKLRNS